MYIVHVLAIDGQTARPAWLLFFYGTRGNRSLLNNGRKYMQKTIQNGTKNEPKRNKKRSKTVKRRSIMVQINDTKKYTKRYKKNDAKPNML